MLSLFPCVVDSPSSSTSTVISFTVRRITPWYGLHTPLRCSINIISIRTCIHLLRPACHRFVSPVPPTLPPPLTVPLPFPIPPAAPALSQTVLEALARNDQFHAHVSALAAGGAAPEPPDSAGPSTSGRTSAYLRRLLGLAGAPRSTIVSANNSSAESSPRALFHDFDGRSGPPSAQSLAAAAGAGSRGGAGAGGVPVLGGVMSRSRKERSVSPIPAASRLSTSADASRAKARQHDPKALAHAALAAVTTGSAGGAGGNSTARHGGRERGDALRVQSANEHLRVNSHGGNRSRVVPVNASLNTSDSPDAHNGSACAADTVGGRSGGGAQEAEGLGGECRPRAAGGSTAGGTTTAETMDGGGDGARPIALGNGLGAESGAGTGEAAGAAVGFSAARRSAGGNSAAQESANFPPEEAAAGGMDAAAVPAGTARKSSSAASAISSGNSARMRRSHDKKGISATSSGASTSNPGHVTGDSGGDGGGSGGGSGCSSPLTASALARLPGGDVKRGSSSRQQKQSRLLQEVEEWLQSASPATPAEAEAAAAAAAAAMAASREGEWRKQEAREAGEGSRGGGKERQGRGSDRARERVGGTEPVTQAKEKDGAKGREREKERERGKERVRERLREERGDEGKGGREKEREREERGVVAAAAGSNSLAENKHGNGRGNGNGNNHESGSGCSSHSQPTQQLIQSAQAAQPGGLEEVGTGGGKNGGAGAADGVVGGGIWQLVREDGQEHSPVSTLDFSQAARPAGETEAEGREGNRVPTIPPVSASVSSVRPSKAVVLPGDVMPRVLSPPPHALADDPASSGAAHSNPFHPHHQQHRQHQPLSPSHSKHHHHHHQLHQQQRQQHQQQQDQQQQCQREASSVVIPRSSTGTGSAASCTDQPGHRTPGMDASAGACMQSGAPMHANSMGGMGGMGAMGGMDAEGMEQDLDYVRHILIAAGFAGPRLPPLHSQDRPIPPHIFPHLESSIVASASPRPLPSSAFPPGSTLAEAEHAKRAEERRQRRLLFDAVNEALGRRLGPYVELPVWAEGLREPLVRPRPVGLALLQEVWGEIHDWPVAASEEVYDILDDAARRDMGRGVDRWVDVIEEIVGVVREVEEAVTMQLIGEVVGEMTDVERQRKARRRNAPAGGSSSAGGGSAPATPTRRPLRSSSGGGLSVQELVGGKNGNPLKGFRWLGRRGL
ncbi:unnamed protein product [Closterium sp. NIES-54]